MYTTQYIHEFQCINLSDPRHTCIHSSSRGEQAHGVQQGGHGERGQLGGPMSSPPPMLPLEEVPRPHAGDTTGRAGDVGGTEANRVASCGEVQATIWTACMAPWCCDGLHRIWLARASTSTVPVHALCYFSSFSPAAMSVSFGIGGY